jgi:hypothetical protein
MYTGTFTSHIYPKNFVHGRIHALNKFLPKKWIGDPLNHIYLTTIIYDGEYNQDNWHTFILNALLPQQVVEINGKRFTFVIKTNTQETISGHYYCENPNDAGEFTLKYK